MEWSFRLDCPMLQATRGLDSLMLQGVGGTPVLPISGAKNCSTCFQSNELAALPCGHMFCPQCLARFNDEFDTVKRCSVCLAKKFRESQAAIIEFLATHSRAHVEMHAQELWDKQKEKMRQLTKRGSLLCTCCQKRAALLLKDGMSPDTAEETKDHTCLYELEIPSLEEIDAAERASFQSKCASRKIIRGSAPEADYKGTRVPPELWSFGPHS